jgi:hypothetical protein
LALGSLPFARGSERGPYATPFSANDFASQSGHSRSVSVCRLKPRMNHRRRLRRRPHRTVTDRPGSALKPAQLAQLHHEPQAARVCECDHGLRRLHDEPSGGFEGCTANRTFASKVARRLRRWHGSSACLLGRLRADFFSSLTGERCSPKRRNKNTPFAIISVAQSRSTFHCARVGLHSITIDPRGQHESCRHGQ